MEVGDDLDKRIQGVLNSTLIIFKKIWESLTNNFFLQLRFEIPCSFWITKLIETTFKLKKTN